MRSLTLGLSLTRGFSRGVPLPAGAGIWSSSGTATASFVGAKLAAGTFTATAGATVAFVGSSTGGPVTWNPSDKEAGITLSNGNLTATSSASNQEVRATLSRTPSGTSYYFEVTLVTAGASVEAVGLANASFALTGYLGDNGSTSNGLYSNGTMLPSNDVAAAFAAGDVIGVELLASSAKWYKNGALVYTLSSLPPGALFPIIGGSTGGVLTGNFGATTLAHLPSGATSWAGSAAGPAAPTITLNTTPSSPVVVDTLNFTIDYASPQTTDTIHFEWTDASDTGFSSAVNSDADADPGTGTAPVTFDVGPFASGSYLFRSRVEDVLGNFSAWTTYGPLTITLPVAPSLDFSNLLHSQYFPVFPL